MNFTLEALDQVIETTGAAYAEAKEALTKSMGDAEAAIELIQAEAAARALEEAADEVEEAAEEAAEEVEKALEEAAEEAEEEAAEEAEEAEENTNPIEDLMQKISDIIKSGQVRKIVVKREGEEVLSVPLNLGLLGGIVGVAAAPTAVILAAIAAYGLDCTIEVEKQDGTTEDF